MRRRRRGPCIRAAVRADTRARLHCAWRPSPAHRRLACSTPTSRRLPGWSSRSSTRAVADIRELAQPRLDLTQLFPKATQFHLLIVAALEFEAAIGQPAPQVTGAIEACHRLGGKRVGDEALGRQCRAVQIPRVPRLRHRCAARRLPLAAPAHRARPADRSAWRRSAGRSECCVARGARPRISWVAANVVLSVGP